MNRINELSTGDFAALCQITKKTLFHYDKIDLLKPIRVDENGYRVYALDQCDKVSTIKLFQKIGMSLQDIQDFFQMNDMSRKTDFLLQQKATALAKINELTAISKGIDFMVTRFAHFREIGVDHFFEETLLQPEPYFLTKKSARAHQSVSAMNYGYQYGVIIDREELQKPLPDFSCIFQRTSLENCNFLKPAGQYRCVYKLLRNDQMLRIVPEIVEAIGLPETAGPLFHEDFCSDIAGFDNQFVVKFSIRIASDPNAAAFEK